MIFLISFFMYLTFTVVTPTAILGQETQRQICDSHPHSGSSNENLESRACNSSKVSYLIGAQKVTWFQAYTLCKHSGMELASIFSEHQEIAVERATRTVPNKVGAPEGYWLAGTRHGAIGTDFVWFTTGKPVIFQKFVTGQPDNTQGIENCLELFLTNLGTFAWNDAPCALKLGFICEKSNC